MAPYIGTPTSRVDGHAKVTGAAKYAGEFNVSGLAYGAVVASTIAKGRIARIDTSEALRVAGVLDVLTHENRPRMAATSAAYKDDVGRKKVRRSARSTTTRSCSAASRSHWCWPRSGRSPASRRRWCASNTRSSRTAPICSPGAIGPLWLKRRSDRAARPIGPMRRPPCATKPNITSRSSITIRWSCTPRR